LLYYYLNQNNGYLLIDLDSVLNKVSLPLGEDDFKEPLTILLEDYLKESNLNRLGSTTFENGIREKLNARAKLLEFIRTQDTTQPSTPIFISGLPRSGTTSLFNVMYCYDGFRSPLTWELFEMTPLAPSKFQRTYKKLKTELRLALFKVLVPNLMNIHPMKSSHPEECQLITALDFKSISFAYSARVPNYQQFIAHCDFSSAFVWHKRFLQAMETTTKPSFWLLKDPCHIQHIEEILAVYPDAKFVFIHRNPIDIIGSISSLAFHLRSAFSKNINTAELGRESLSFWGEASQKFLASKNLISESNMIDISFNDFTKDPSGIAEKIFAKFNIRLNDENKARMASYTTQKTRSSQKHNYNLNDFDLNDKEVDQVFESYREAFNL